MYVAISCRLIGTRQAHFPPAHGWSECSLSSLLWSATSATSYLNFCISSPWANTLNPVGANRWKVMEEEEIQKKKDKSRKEECNLAVDLNPNTIDMNQKQKKGNKENNKQKQKVRYWGQK